MAIIEKLLNVQNISDSFAYIKKKPVLINDSLK